MGAKALLSDESHWTKDVGARNQDGYAVSPRDAAAVCWCGYGAVLRQYDPNYVEEIPVELRKIMGRATGTQQPFSVWQDRKTRTHADVLAAFDRAIEMCVV